MAAAATAVPTTTPTDSQTTASVSTLSIPSEMPKKGSTKLPAPVQLLRNNGNKHTLTRTTFPKIITTPASTGTVSFDAPSSQIELSTKSNSTPGGNVSDGKRKAGRKAVQLESKGTVYVHSEKPGKMSASPIWTFLLAGDDEACRLKTTIPLLKQALLSFGLDAKGTKDVLVERVLLQKGKVSVKNL
ncbi:hypothetical protein BT69DRAFT_1329528 [Atractiella rhizophila]|nr:hypothetical protein BT69DRAFT_1329528 [Atractiella rhizophila]